MPAMVSGSDSSVGFAVAPDTGSQQPDTLGTNLPHVAVEEVPVKTNRLLESVKDAPVTNSAVPNTVSNYHLAIEGAPRVCGNCRFFQGEKGLNGQCGAYDFTAAANYICDAWQSTPNSATFSNGWGEKAITEHVGQPQVTPGRVPQQNIVDIPIHETTIAVEQSNVQADTETVQANEVIRAYNKEYVPGDIVYSKSLQSHAQVQASHLDGSIRYYSLKLLREDGTAYGSGFSVNSDLQPRSKAAMKRVKSVKTDEDMDEMIASCRNVHARLKELCEAHEDILVNPLSNKDTIMPLAQELKAVLEQPVYKGVKTGPRRKYYRAVQTALSSIGAARGVLFEAYQAINDLQRSSSGGTKGAMRRIMIKAQTEAYDRLDMARQAVEDALVLPSATHETEAPGITPADL